MDRFLSLNYALLVVLIVYFALMLKLTTMSKEEVKDKEEEVAVVEQSDNDLIKTMRQDGTVPSGDAIQMSDLGKEAAQKKKEVDWAKRRHKILQRLVTSIEIFVFIAVVVVYGVCSAIILNTSDFD